MEISRFNRKAPYYLYLKVIGCYFFTLNFKPLPQISVSQKPIIKYCNLTKASLYKNFIIFSKFNILFPDELLKTVYPFDLFIPHSRIHRDFVPFLPKLENFISNLVISILVVSFHYQLLFEPFKFLIDLSNIIIAFIRDDLGDISLQYLKIVRLIPNEPVYRLNDHILQYLFIHGSCMAYTSCWFKSADASSYYRLAASVVPVDPFEQLFALTADDDL